MAFNGFKKPEMMQKLTDFAVKKNIPTDEIEQIVDAALGQWDGNEKIIIEK